VPRTEIQKKLTKLKEILSGTASCLVAFSGGVDSSFLLAIAREVLKDKVLAGIAISPTFPKRELGSARKIAKRLKVKLIEFRSRELKLEAFYKNSPLRCYYCKEELFSELKAIAQKKGLKWVVEGSNLDDLSDYRPGRKAILELGIRSPLLEAGLSKAEVRRLSKRIGLETWDKPSFACLASRIPYGEEINLEKLRKIERAEQVLFKLGFQTFRVRYHQEVARVELDNRGRNRLLREPGLGRRIYQEFSKIGFLYTAMDLLGYRSGSMNLGLNKGRD